MTRHPKGKMAPSPPPSRRDSVLIPLLASAVALALLGLSTYFILKSRASYLNEFRIRSQTQAQLLGENTASLIHAVDLSLLSARAVARALPRGDQYPVLPVIESIRREIRLLPQVRNLILMDAREKVVYTAKGQEARILDTYREHRDAWLDFGISTRFTQRDQVVILMSRRLENSRGDFMGVLAAEIDPGFFFERYNDYLNITADAVMLFDTTGNILAPWAGTRFFSRARPGDSIYDFFKLPRGSRNTIDAAGIKTVEDDRFITAVYQTRGFPFRVILGHEKTGLLEKWRGENKRVLFMIALTYLVAIVTLILGLGQAKKRRRAEAQLRQYQLGLEETVRKRTRQLDDTNASLVEKNRELVTAINEIKLLKGIIPICSHCKNVRDDSGYWQQVEEYIRTRSDADFSHGICPDCAEKYYPDLKIYKE